MQQPYNLAWLKQKADAGDTLKFIFFWGHTNPHNAAAGKFCLSQWYECPFTVDHQTYPTSEHWMMAQKALLFGDEATFQKIIRSHKPGEAKDLGRQVTGFDEQLWNERRYDIVKQGNLHKFSQHPALAAYLLQTENRILVEASPIDAIWGIGLSQDDKNSNNVHAWPGMNLLGFALMEVRDLLKTEPAYALKGYGG